MSRVSHTQLYRSSGSLCSRRVSCILASWHPGYTPYSAACTYRRIGIDCAAATSNSTRQNPRVFAVTGAVQHVGMDPDKVLSLARCLRRCRSTPDLSFTAVSLLSKVCCVEKKPLPFQKTNHFEPEARSAFVLLYSSSGRPLQQQMLCIRNSFQL